MNLDDRIREATEELQRRTPIDPVRGLGDLRRTRTRRTAGSVIAVGTLILVTTLAWASTLDDDKPQPVPPVPRVGNGVLVGLVDPGTVDAVPPGTLARLPFGESTSGALAFSADGAELFYVGRDGEVEALDVDRGTVRELAVCDDPVRCLAGVSPDSTQIAFSVAGKLLVQSERGETNIPLPGVGPLGGVITAPVWSPDGTRLAFSTPKGLYVVGAAGGGLRLVAPSNDERTLALPPSWSPDGGSLVYLAGAPVRGTDPGGSAVDARYTVVTLDLTTGETRELTGAGRCFCLGTPPPAVAWSPDGRLIALAGVPPRRGVYTVPAAGGEVERLSTRAFYGALAWQPVND